MINRASDGYIELIKKFALRPIESQEHNNEALKVLAELSVRDGRDELSSDEIAYFKVLANLVKEFERVHTQPPRESSPQEVLFFLLETHGIKQIELASKLDIPKSHICSFLSGARSLTKSEVARIAANFGLNPLLLLPGDYFSHSGTTRDKTVTKPNSSAASKYRKTAKKPAAASRKRSEKAIPVAKRKKA